MYIKKYICTTYVKYHSTSLSSPPVIPHLMQDPFGLDSRFRGNDTPLSSSTESKALRIGDPFGLDSRFRGNNGRGAGMTGGTRITTDELSITINNPTGQASRYSLFFYLKWLHPCGKPQGIQLS